MTSTPPPFKRQVTWESLETAEGFTVSCRLRNLPGAGWRFCPQPRWHESRSLIRPAASCSAASLSRSRPGST